jgi:hypothetical protein
VAKPFLAEADPPEEIAEKALDRCKAREAALKAILTRRVGTVRAERVAAEVRGAVRSGLVQAIETFRAN